MLFDAIFLFLMYTMMVVTPLYAIYNLIVVILEEKQHLKRKRKINE